jgi:cytochrome c biogenesis protein CcdA
VNVNRPAFLIVAAICSFLLRCQIAVGETPPENGFLVAPYLIDVGVDSATVAFHLRDPLPAEVRVHTDEGAERSQSSEPSTSHFISVTGLAPGSVSTYEVICGENEVRTPEGDESYQIRTAGLPGESFSFAVYGDPRPGENQTHRHHEEIVRQIQNVEPAFCLALGDLVDDGRDPRQWEEFFRIESEVLRRSAIFPVVGDNDHQEGRGLAGRYFPSLGRGYYHFDWCGVHFFALNAWGTTGSQPESEFDLKSDQMRWLAAEVSREEVRNAPFRVVFLHDPVRISRGTSSDVLRSACEEVFTEHGVDVVFASWHLYERSHHQGVTYIISGGAGAELIWGIPNPAIPAQAEARSHHFCRVDVQAGMMRIRAIAKDGTVLDSMTLFPRTREGRSPEDIQRMARRLSVTFDIGGGKQDPRLPLYLFSYDCAYCRRLLRRDLPQWAEEYGVPLRVEYYDLGLRGVYDLLTAAGADFGRQGAGIPAIFIGRTVLGGESEINEGMPRELGEFRRNPRLYRENAIVPFLQRHDTRALRSEEFEGLTLGIILAAGLLDGVNPCAFTTIIFLISCLSFVGSDRRRILEVGGIFTTAVFLTYLSIGVFFYQFAGFLFRREAVSTVIRLLLLFLLIILAILSAWDFVRCLRGDVKGMTLQLPRVLKQRIQERIRDYAETRLAAGTAALMLGVTIAGMELACTGQVYIPIVAMISEPRYRASAMLSLILYNLAFIVPLVAVFLFAAFGVTSRTFARLFQRHVATVKLGTTILFLVMALLITYNLGWL